MVKQAYNTLLDDEKLVSIQEVVEEAKALAKKQVDALKADRKRQGLEDFSALEILAQVLECVLMLIGRSVTHAWLHRPMSLQRNRPQSSLPSMSASAR